MSERYIEMFWRCSSCNHRNLGRHQVCQSCKHPKDGSEPYEMPENTAAAVSVTDAALLRMATAGPNWRCAYCESDQRALDGSCENCGAALPPSNPGPDKKAPAASSNKGCLYLFLTVAVFGWFWCGPMTVHDKGPGKTRSYTPPPSAQTEVKRGPEWTRSLQVTAVSWEHSVHIQRYRKVEHEGFEEARPADAADVRPVGRRHHHDERVSDGYDTVSYTERVRDGYDTERYTEQEECGKDCTSTRETCKETCTSTSNGFARCTTTCSGGGQRCTPRTCTVTKTRQVPRYVVQKRSRREPRYKTVSHDAEWYVWKAWEWVPDRTVEAKGSTLETHWPKDSELRPSGKLLAGEKERNSRLAQYRVVFQGPGLEPVTYQPANLEEFMRFAPGSMHVLQKDNGQVSVLPPEGPEAPAPKPEPTRTRPKQ